MEAADPAVPQLPAAERAEPIADWFIRTVTPAGLPHLYRALPALMAADCAADFGHELDLLIHGLRTSAHDGQGEQGGDRTSLYPDSA
jgi:hypothetical protein